jgi:multidrug/hemolysin transport system ATP-binding protein
MIEVKNLKKSYGDFEAVKGIDFQVEEGSFVAFLGENGAGKSTTINMLSTLLKKTSGEASINGHFLDEKDELIRKNIGVVFQNSMLDDFLTVKENLISRGKLYGYRKNELDRVINRLSDQIGIHEILSKKYGKLSGGQRRRADIARALVGKPKVLILDEPTTGLDPYTRKNVWDCILQLREEEALTVFLTTHYMEEAANADQIIIIDKGEIIENDSPANLKVKYSEDTLVFYPKEKNTIIKKLVEKEHKVKIEGEKYICHIKNNLDAIKIIGMVKDEIDGFELIKGNLDQVFMTLVEQNQERRESYV